MATTKLGRIRLADIVIDISIRHRRPEQFTVNGYRQAFRAGAQFPPLVIERCTKRLVCGHHRYEMYCAELEPTAEVTCIFEDYPSELALWERAVSDNVLHGRPLDTFDKKCILLKMTDMGASKEAVALLLNVPLDKVEEWDGMLVVVTGERSGVPYESSRPVKHGLEFLAGQRMSEEDYERNVKQRATGVEAGRHAFALRTLLESNLIDLSNDKTMAELKALYQALEHFLVGKAVA